MAITLDGTNDITSPNQYVNGNVGIGTSSPAYMLHVSGATPIIGLTDTDTGADSYISANSSGGSLIISADENNEAATTVMTFRTDGAERMRIDASGNVSIGSSTNYNSAGFGTNVSLYHTTSAAVTYQTSARQYQVGIASNGQYGVYDATSAAWALTFNSSLNAYFGSNVVAGQYLVSTLAGGTTTTDPGVWGGIYAGTYGRLNFIKSTASGTGSTPACQFYYNGTTIGSIGNTSTATTFNTSSDYRLKENIQPMQNALDVVAQLNPVTYTWKADGSDGQGFIAHELQAVVPDCVTGEKDAVDEDGNPIYQGIDTSFLVATLCKAIQELNEKVEAQAAEIAALKGV